MRLPERCAASDVTLPAAQGLERPDPLRGSGRGQQAEGPGGATPQPGDQKCRISQQSRGYADELFHQPGRSGAYKASRPGQSFPAPYTHPQLLGGALSRVLAPLLQEAGQKELGLMRVEERALRERDLELSRNWLCSSVLPRLAWMSQATSLGLHRTTGTQLKSG